MLQVRFSSYCNKGNLPKNSKTSNKQNGKAIRSIFNVVSSLLLEKLHFTETATIYPSQLWNHCELWGHSYICSERGGGTPKCMKMWKGRGVFKEHTHAYIFFKAAFSHLYCAFLFFTSLMRKWKLQHLEKLTLLLNIHQVFYIAFQLIPQDIGITSRNAIWL